jgi:ATP-binding cassette subfamily B multidrug efflux pump
MTEPRALQRPTVAEPPPLMGRFGPPQRNFGEIERPKRARSTIMRLWGYLRRQNRALLLAAPLVIITTILTVISPYLITLTIDGYVLPGDLPGLMRIGLLMMGIYILSALLTWLQNYIIAGAAQQTVRDIRDDMFEHLQHLPLRFFDQRAHGDLMSRLTNDVENINLALTDGVAQLISGFLGIIGIAAIMLWVNPILALVGILSISSMTFFINRWVAPRTRSGFRAQQAALGKLNGLIEETITGQRVVKAYHREPIVIEQFDSANRTLRQAATRAQIFAGFIGPMMNVMNNLGLAIIVGVGSWMALRGMATVGTIAGFITYARQFGRPLNELATLYNTLQSAIAGAERVFAVIDEAPETDAPDAQPLAQLHGEVVFEGVDFSYTAGVPVLQQVSLRAEPGQIVALVGPTGAGKTTIVNLLTRFYEIDGGCITIDGQAIQRIAKDDLRRQLGIVLQDTFLFAGSVMDNIRYGRLDASDDEVLAAARLANADQFIHRLPQGYATPLTERGGNLSQGQRQLLAIARAILADPRILILDEATSSVDTRTEQHIQEAMLRLMEGRTSFVIAHRLSTIRDADQILVIDQGKLVERGTHDELLDQQGFYARLYASQFQADAAPQEERIAIEDRG